MARRAWEAAGLSSPCRLRQRSRRGLIRGERSPASATFGRVGRGTGGASTVAGGRQTGESARAAAGARGVVAPWNTDALEDLGFRPVDTEAATRGVHDIPAWRWCGAPGRGKS